MSTTTNRAALLTATIKDAFGELPADVLLELRIAIDTFGQLEALFDSIKADLDKSGGKYSRAFRLASVGAYLASDTSNSIDCEHEKFRDNLTSHGIDCGGEQ